MERIKDQQPFFEKDEISAMESKGLAQWIAFGPIVFQAARVLRNSGILAVIEKHFPAGLTAEEIRQHAAVSEYGTRVLLESGLSIGLVVVDSEGRYNITKTGHFIIHDELTNINMDFVHDVCYKAMYSLDKSIETGKPAGLSIFGEWETIYEGLGELPKQVQKSWFAFDHYFSDNAFRAVLREVVKHQPKKLMDIGGNTGKWAIACTLNNPPIQVTIVDLPGQLKMAKLELEKRGLLDKVELYPANVLKPGTKLPGGHDVIWMSQFLDCFSEEQIEMILRKCHDVLEDDGLLFIMEPFWDCQAYKTAAFCLLQTYLYFTALANGNSQMYSSEIFKKILLKAGFDITEQQDNIGLSQTLLTCRKSPEKAGKTTIKQSEKILLN
jgi:ubiquinone/menaquinone biosynthesis C-methylase UbiE